MQGVQQGRLEVAASAVLAAILLSSGLAEAQIAERPLLDQFLSPNNAGGTSFQPGVTVVSRARPEYDSSGVQFGNFVIRPVLTESAGYESNVLGTTRPHGSPVISTNATLDASADWSITSVRASLSVDDERYPSQRQQSFTNWSAALGGSYEVGRDIVLARYAHSVSSQTPTSLDVAQLDQSLPITLDDVQLAYRFNLSRTFLQPTIDVASYTFQNGTAGGANYLQTYRDRVVVAPSLTAGYELSPRRNVVVVFRDADAAYSHPLPGQPRRNYNDAAVLGGLDYDADGVVRYRALVGYEYRRFQSSQYKTIQSPVAEASAIWTPTGLTTVTGTVARRIEDSADETTAAFTESYVQLRIDHEYLPNVLLRANAGIYFSSYRGGAGQEFYTAGTGVTYLLNRNMQVAASYDFSARQSDGQGNLGATGQNFGSGYTDHRIALQLRLGL